MARRKMNRMIEAREKAHTGEWRIGIESCMKALLLTLFFAKHTGALVTWRLRGKQKFLAKELRGKGPLRLTILAASRETKFLAKAQRSQGAKDLCGLITWLLCVKQKFLAKELMGKGPLRLCVKPVFLKKCECSIFFSPRRRRSICG